MYFEALILAGFAFCYSLFAGRVEHMWISGPIVFVSFGAVMGPLGFGWLDGELNYSWLRLLADLTLALILFSDAAEVKQSVLRARFAIPARMLLIGLPGAIVLGGIAALVVFDTLTLFEAAILGAMLAATDAALGKAVVTDPRLPNWMRVGLNVESGLNDGLCVPFLLVFLALALNAEGAGVGHVEPLVIVLEEVGIGLTVGLSVTFFAVYAIRFCLARAWVTNVWRQMTVPALALICFSLASQFDGSGYIAAFSGGLLFGHLLRDDSGHFLLAAEAVGEGLAMLTWLTFGATTVALVLGGLNLNVALYVLVSLTLVRIVPVFISLSGTQATVQERLFMGWFGPRGLASIVFVVIVLDSGLAAGELIALIVSTTVFFSLLLHGVSAQPLTARLARNEQAED